MVSVELVSPYGFRYDANFIIFPWEIRLLIFRIWICVVWRYDVNINIWMASNVFANRCILVHAQSTVSKTSRCTIMSAVLYGVFDPFSPLSVTVEVISHVLLLPTFMCDECRTMQISKICVWLKRKFLNDLFLFNRKCFSLLCKNIIEWVFIFVVVRFIKKYLSLGRV